MNLYWFEEMIEKKENRGSQDRVCMCVIGNKKWHNLPPV